MVKIQILDNTWKFYVLEDDEFAERFGEGDAAVTLPDTYEVYFSADEVTRVNVRHELAHVYYASMCVHAAELTVDQVEEVFAEMIGQNGPGIIKKAQYLYRLLKEEADS